MDRFSAINFGLFILACYSIFSATALPLSEVEGFSAEGKSTRCIYGAACVSTPFEVPSEGDAAARLVPTTSRPLVPTTSRPLVPTTSRPLVPTTSRPPVPTAPFPSTAPVVEEVVEEQKPVIAELRSLEYLPPMDAVPEVESVTEIVTGGALPVSIVPRVEEEAPSLLVILPPTPVLAESAPLPPPPPPPAPEPTPTGPTTPGPPVPEPTPPRPPAP